MSGRFKLTTGAGAAGVVAAVLGWCLWKTSVRSLTLTSVAVAGTPAAADEVRTFAVSVDGKPGGTYTIATTAGADGSETTTVAAEVKVKTPLYTYTYHLNSAEVWQKGRLVSLESKANDDGKKHAVTAVAGEQGLTVTANKDRSKVPADVITSTGVRVPAGDKARDAVLFEAEDGTTTVVRVEPLGACRVTLNGQAIDGTKFKLTGKDVAAEWWFDANGRVIRQEMKWDGHKVVLELTGVK